MSEPEITIDWNEKASTHTITVVWVRQISVISIPIEFIPYDPSNGRKTDDPV